MGLLKDKHGREYQEGAVYEFSDDGKDWVSESLLKIIDHKYPFFTRYTSWKMIRECHAPLGTIKEPEVELIEGEWYLCEVVLYQDDVCKIACYYRDGEFRDTDDPTDCRPNKGIKPLYRLVREG